MRWGLVPSWWKRPFREFNVATFNARAETVEDKAAFRFAFKRTRCLIPAFWLLRMAHRGGGKQPYYFTARDATEAWMFGLSLAAVTVGLFELMARDLAGIKREPQDKIGFDRGVQQKAIGTAEYRLDDAA